MIIKWRKPSENNSDGRLVWFFDIGAVGNYKNMELDFAFIAKMLRKHASHLAAQKKFIEENVEFYQKAIDSMERIGDEQKYRKEIQIQEFKKAEAFEKLSHVVPNIQKINEQIVLLETTN